MKPIDINANMAMPFPAGAPFPSIAGSNINIWLKQGLLALGLMGFVCLLAALPQGFAIFVFLMCLLSSLAFIKPKYFLYISVAYLCFRYLFTPSLMGYQAGSLDFLRVGSQNAPLIKYADEWVGVMSGILVFKLYIVEWKRNWLISQSKIVFLASLFIAFSILSGIINLVDVLSIVYFIQIFLRPVFPFLLIMLLNWEEKELENLFIFILIIIMPYQIFFSCLQNIRPLMEGNIFWRDDFTGTFVLPYCQVVACLIAFGFMLYVGRFLIVREKKTFAILFICLLSIIAAAVAFFTIVWLSCMICMILWLLFRPADFDIEILPFKKTLVVMIIIVIGTIGYIFYNPPEFAKEKIVDYTLYKLEQAQEKPLMEQSKILGYIILTENILNGNIEPLLGLGPGQFLSGAAFREESNSSKQFSEESMIEGEIGAGEYFRSTTVGLIGEIGFLGWLSYIVIYLMIGKMLVKNIQYIRNIVWHGRYIGTIAILFFMVCYSFTYGAMEAAVEPLIMMMLCAISLKVAELYKINYTGVSPLVPGR